MKPTTAAIILVGGFAACLAIKHSQGPTPAPTPVVSVEESTIETPEQRDVREELEHRQRVRDAVVEADAVLRRLRAAREKADQIEHPHPDETPVDTWNDGSHP